MKNRYEILLALNVSDQDESYQDIGLRLEKLLIAEGAETESIEHLERRSFAYPHQKIKSAYFISYIVHIDSSLLSNLRTRLALQPEILLHNYFKKNLKPSGLQKIKPKQ